MESRGIVLRVASAELAFLASQDGRSFTFSPLALLHIDNDERAQLLQGQVLAFEVDGESRISSAILSQTAIPGETFKPERRDESVAPLQLASQSEYFSERFELLPEQECVCTHYQDRAIPNATRNFGKVIDFRSLQPGDLILTRESKPDHVSKVITTVQRKGGYNLKDACWTHAAIYVGDGQSVVEATFDGLWSGGRVQLTNLDAYASGEHILRVRRSRSINTPEMGWKLCLRALRRLKEAYGMRFAIQLWANVTLRDEGFYSGDRVIPTSAAVVCSTLFADAHAEATRVVLGEVNGVCVPAWLSASDNLYDLQVGWAKLQ